MPLPRIRAVLYRGRYYAEWRKHGQVRRRSLRTADRDAANAALKAFIEGLELANRPARPTVDYVWQRYCESLGDRPSAKTMAYEWKAIEPHFGAMVAESITETDCVAYTEKRREGGSD